MLELRCGSQPRAHGPGELLRQLAHFDHPYLNDSISGLISEKIVSGSNTTTKDYLMVAGVIIGTHHEVNSNTPVANYFVLDYQGSVRSNRRNWRAPLPDRLYSMGEQLSIGLLLTAPDREFLGQELINSGAPLNLINLNARVFDPRPGPLHGTRSDPSDMRAQSLLLTEFAAVDFDPSGLTPFYRQKWFTRTLAPILSIGAALLGFEFLPSLLLEGDFIAATSDVASWAALGMSQPVWRYLKLERSRAACPASLPRVAEGRVRRGT